MKPSKKENQGHFSKSRREFLQQVGRTTSWAIASPMLSRFKDEPNQKTSRPAVKPFDWKEATIAQLQEEMQTGKLTARALVENYLDRIEAVDKRGPAINAVIELKKRNIK
jgi:amidase